MTHIRNKKTFLPITLSAVLISVLIYYGWTIALSDYTSGFLYNKVTDAFLSKRLDMGIPLDPSFVKDPLDYDKHHEYIAQKVLDDFSVYKGKVYSYFGAVPVLTFYIPYRLIMKTNWCPDHAAVLFFCFGCLLWATLILLYLRQKYFHLTSRWMIVFFSAVIGFANVSPWLTRSAARYSVAISGGMFYMTAAVYFLFTAFKNYRPSAVRLFWGSLFCGLAVGCRPNLVFPLIAIIPIVLIKIAQTGNKNTLKPYFTAALLPLSVCFVFLFIYNYARFENIFDFGTQYIISYSNKMPGKYSLPFERIIRNGYLIFFHAPVIDTTFPYAHIRFSLPSYIHGDSSCWAERPVGLFLAIPFTQLIFLAPIIYWLRTKDSLLSVFSKKGILSLSVLFTVLYYYGLIFSIRLLENLNRYEIISIIFSLLEKIRDQVPLGFVFAVFFILQVLKAVIDTLKRAQKIQTRFPLFEAAILGSMIMTLYPCIILKVSTFRYAADYATAIILLACIVWFYFDSFFRENDISRRFLLILTLCLGLISILLAISFSIKGYSN